jgi:hypothetical protein
VRARRGGGVGGRQTSCGGARRQRGATRVGAAQDRGPAHPGRPCQAGGERQEEASPFHAPERNQWRPAAQDAGIDAPKPFALLWVDCEE